MISIHDLTVRYGDVPALNQVSLTIQSGEWVLVSGRSGCGKSTLVKALCGVIPHIDASIMSGTVIIDGFDTRNHPVATIAEQVGVVFQNPESQLFHLRVEDEVAFGPRNLGLSEADVQARTTWAMRVTNLTALRDNNPAELSGGQKQIVAIASVLAMKPRVLVLDEPLASLDTYNARCVIETLDNLCRNHGMTIIMIEHRLETTLPYVDRVVLMEDGQITLDDAPQALQVNPSYQTRFGLGDVFGQNPDSLQSPEPQNREPLLVLDDVWAGYRKIDVLRGVHFELYPGDFSALVGPNGAGKSTLALVAAGLLKPRKGKVRFAAGKRYRPGLDVALLFQNAANQLFTDSVAEEVAFAPHNYGCFQPDNHRQVMTEADLLALADRRPNQLSVGQQQRTALAACLALRPALIILDEPTLGQDWGHLQQLMDYLMLLNANGTAILLISHDEKLVQRYVRHVSLIQDGQIIDKAKQPQGLQHEIYNA
ncbi:MAG: energy-coupling factor ABC transporter ATP-binding protein [Anaerolineae bacterium]|nr:energy-coupling factor ABC transporter ATP-binding protein [Anaerolineae bacterium]